jgi:hydrogenase maturation protein HypF
MVRRARGFVPEPLPLPVAAPTPVLALGPFLQATACLAAGCEAFVSQHVGDLDGEPARAFLEEVVDGLEEFLQARGELLVVDEHPDYPSTALGERLAAERSAPLLRVQHHLAHAAAVLAEHGAFPPPGTRVAAIALDGTGWGSDGTAWGGEWLLLDGDLGWRRLASLEPLPLVGGEAAVREPWRVLLAALARQGALGLLPRLPVARLVASDRFEAVARLAAQADWPMASGAGRVFEAAGALLGLVAVNGWEGEAAARLEALAASAWPSAPWPDVFADPGSPSPLPSPLSSLPSSLSSVPGPRAVLPSAALLTEAARRTAADEPAAAVAAGFHATLCRLVVELTTKVVPAGVRTVAVGGGCLVNRLLRDGLARGLAGAGYDALFPQQLPPGDGGIAYGQAVLGAVAAATGTGPREEG